MYVHPISSIIPAGGVYVVVFYNIFFTHTEFMIKGLLTCSYLLSSYVIIHNKICLKQTKICSVNQEKIEVAFVIETVSCVAVFVQIRTTRCVGRLPRFDVYLHTECAML